MNKSKLFSLKSVEELQNLITPRLLGYYRAFRGQARMWKYMWDMGDCQSSMSLEKHEAEQESKDLEDYLDTIKKELATRAHVPRKQKPKKVKNRRK